MTQLISDKEKKSSSYRDNRLESLSEEKVAKIKKFSKEYIAKIIRKMDKASKIPTSSSTSTTTQDTPSTSLPTPNSHDGDANSFQPPMFSGEPMGMDLDDDSGSDFGGDKIGSDEGDEDDQMDNADYDRHVPDVDVPVPDVGKSSTWNPLPLAERLGPRRGCDDTSMDIDDSRFKAPHDPRRHRPANG